MATVLGPTDPILFSLDNGLLFEDDPFGFPSLEDLQARIRAMTAEEVLSGDAESFAASQFSVDHFYNEAAFVGAAATSHVAATAQDASAASEAPFVAGRQNSRSHLPVDQSHFGNAIRGQGSAVSGSSLSPRSLVLTPTSTLDHVSSDYNHLEVDQLYQGESVSPTSTFISENEFEIVPHPREIFALQLRQVRQADESFGDRTPASLRNLSGARQSQLESRDTSVTPSTMSFSSGAAQWGSLSNANPGMDHEIADQSRRYDNDFFQFTTGDYLNAAPLPTTSQSNDHQHSLAHPSGFDSSTAGFGVNHGLVRPQVVPAQPVDASFVPSNTGYSYPQQQHPMRQITRPGTLGQQTTLGPQPTLDHPPAVNNNFQSLNRVTPACYGIPQRQLPGRSLQQSPMGNTRPMPFQTRLRTSQQPPAIVPSQRTRSPPRQLKPATQHSSTDPARQQRPHSGTPIFAEQMSPRALPNIASAPPRPATDPSHPPTAGRTGKGGRPTGKHLKDDKRLRIKGMRHSGACWCCVFQRDSCDNGTPCSRCVTKLQKGMLRYVPCDRSKLPSFIYDFLPPEASMTVMHQKQSIEDTIQEQVIGWHSGNAIDLYLTSGYGPPLMWKVYEFEARTDDLLGQYQYLQDPATGQLKRYHKFSPPLGLMKLDTSDDVHFNQYLNQCMQPGMECLGDLGWTCFEEESQVDEYEFQAKLLDQMCRLYLATNNIELKQLLKDVIKMMIITYIMGHTLTICDETLPDVFSRLKHPRPAVLSKHTSPRLANRQLKFYFAIMRSNIYERLLKWQQQVLHESKGKTESWLTSFCAMLGFAMVLEEIQRTLQIQMDAKIAKNELPHQQAVTEAQNACNRIDERYGLLIGLFQCKYRDKKWIGRGSFGPSTPRYADSATNEFLGNVREMLHYSKAHLERRKVVEFAPENTCLYTSRLVARFLLPFLNLPAQ